MSDTSPKDAEKAEHDLMVRLVMAETGSCTCLTKTPEPEYHDILCRYRTIRDAQSALSQVRKQAYEKAAVLIEQLPCECCWPDSSISIAEEFAAEIRKLAEE